MRKIGKEKKRIFWDAHKNLGFITKKSQHYTYDNELSKIYVVVDTHYLVGLVLWSIQIW